MANQGYDIEASADPSEQDGAASSARMIGGLAAMILAYPALAVWLFLKGFGVIQVFILVPFLGALFFVGLLIAGDALSEWRKQLVKKKRDSLKSQFRGISISASTIPVLNKLQGTGPHNDAL